MNLRDKLNQLEELVAKEWQPYLQLNVDIPLDIEELYDYRHNQRGIYIECQVLGVRDGFIIINPFDGKGSKQIDRNQFPIQDQICLLYTSPSPRDRTRSRMPSSA